MQFGNYNQEGLYRNVLERLSDGLTENARALLYIALCLADEDTGVLHPHEGGADTLTRNDLLKYTTMTTAEYADAFDMLLRREYFVLWYERGRRVIQLNDYICYPVRRSRQARKINLIHPVVRQPEPVKMHTPPRPTCDQSSYDLSDKQAGFIYIAHAENGLYKIGKARNPTERVKGFAGAVMPFQITLIHTIYSRRAREIEGTLHFVFQEKRRSGEWFALERRDVQWLQQFRELHPDTLEPFWAALQEHEKRARFF